jgi:hypothetical protein
MTESPSAVIAQPKGCAIRKYRKSEYTEQGCTAFNAIKNKVLNWTLAEL